MRFLGRAALALTVTLPGFLSAAPARAQQARIRVATSVGGADSVRVASSLAAAFRAIGDVDVVTKEERPDYVVSAVTMCEEPAVHEVLQDCDDALFYTASIVLTEPDTDWRVFTRARAWFDARGITIQGFRKAEAIMADSGTAITKPNGDELFLRAWVAAFGRERIDSEMKGIVAEIDRSCFERDRLNAREIAAWQAGDTTVAFPLIRRLNTDPALSCN